jgi:hypothetical protein
MVTEPRIQVRDFALNAIEEKQIQRLLEQLQRRMEPYGEPVIKLVLDWHPDQRLVRTRMRVQLGHLGPHLTSAQSAETADRSVRQAVATIERQFERRLATRRGEASWGVPSRRAPSAVLENPQLPAPPDDAADEFDEDAFADWPVEDDFPAG